MQEIKANYIECLVYLFLIYQSLVVIILKQQKDQETFWSFTQFGDNIICSNGTDPIQKLNEIN